jgi:hypothetical protein
MASWPTEDASRRRVSKRSRAASDDVKPGGRVRSIVIALSVSSTFSNADGLTSSSAGGERAAEYARGVRVDRLIFEPELCRGRTVA